MTELARMIAAKKVSPVEVVQAHLDRIAALDGKLKSYITVMGESALAAAKAAEAAVHAGADLGPLHGVPMGLKDLYCTKGVKTTGGSKILGNWVPAEDVAFAAGRLPDRARRWRPASVLARSARTRAGPSAFPRPSAASPASSRPTDA